MLRIGEHPENLKIRQILIQTMGTGRDFAIVPPGLGLLEWMMGFG